MSEGLDIAIVKEMYRRFSDAELIRFASTDAHGLTPEAQQAIKEEINFRRLDPGIVDAIDIQNKLLTLEELDSYCALVLNSGCPICNSRQVMNAIVVSETMSFILFTHQKKKLLFGCSKCLKTENNTALLTTIILGWWGFPHGIIRSIGSISTYIKSSGTLKSNGINNNMRDFVQSNIGLFKMYKDSPENLALIIQNHNNGIQSSANNV